MAPIGLLKAAVSGQAVSIIIVIIITTRPAPTAMNLQTELDQERVYWLQQQPAPASAVECMAMDYLHRDGIEARALRVGERAPGFRLADRDGRAQSLDQLLARGPTVLLFFRGLWCPFCELTLRAFAEAAPRFAALRSPLVAITPQRLPPANVPDALPLLADIGSHVARAYGLAYDLPPNLKLLFEQHYQTPLPQLNADGGWTLPVPAAFIVDTNGQVLWAQLDIDYRRRASPETLLAWLVSHHMAADTARARV